MRPFIAFTAFAGAGLDVGFASATLRGELTILQVDLKFKGSIQIAVGSNLFKLSISAPFTLATMKGRIFVKVTWNLIIWSGEEGVRHRQLGRLDEDMGPVPAEVVDLVTTAEGGPAFRQVRGLAPWHPIETPTGRTGWRGGRSRSPVPPRAATSRGRRGT